MNTNNLESIRDSLTAFGNEMMTSSGVRAVSAWLAMSDPDPASYDLEDEEAPYALRSTVGTSIGWEAAWEGLDPQGDIPRYLAYMVLRGTYGPEWPTSALLDYMETVKGMDRAQSAAATLSSWNTAMEHYEAVRDSLPREEEDELVEAAA
jgi:hypothetical protein